MQSARLAAAAFAPPRRGSAARSGADQEGTIMAKTGLREEDEWLGLGSKKLGGWVKDVKKRLNAVS